MTGGLAAVAARRVWFCDLDGTLIDSAPVHAAAFRDALADLAPGLLGRFRYQDHAGTGTSEAMARLGAGPDLARRLARRKQHLYRSYVDAGRVRLRPGARRLLDRLAARGRAVYLVTSGSRASVERVLTACALAGRFRGTLARDDVPAGKPDPLVYREACRRWAARPREVVVVEDSAHGVAAAVGAGLLTLQVYADRPAPGAVAVTDLDEVAAALEPEVGRGDT